MAAQTLKVVEEENSESQQEGLDPEEVFVESIRSCCVALFEGCGTPVSTVGEEHDVETHLHHAGFAGLIGFGGTEVRGSLVMYFDETLVVATRPQTLGRVDDQDAALRDWTGEMANQLLGRVKNNLLKYNVKVAMGVPTAISGQGYTLTSVGDMSPVRLRFTSEFGNLSLLLNMRFRPGLRLDPPNEEEEDTAAEGDLMLF